ncbi:EamA family transporter RarD [Buchananella felis]|uniref:EamA family transporter RarD n=1 Tax=Buchananella felis TaxID=3231492 RepID=UPI00352892C0
MPTSTPAPGLDRTGLVTIVSCYVVWGLFPLYFRLLNSAGAGEIIAYRASMTLLTCLTLIALWRGAGRRLLVALRSRRTVGMLALAGALIAVNWLVYVFGVNTGRTADAAIGYFLNPLVTVALGYVFLGERLRRLQLVSLGVAAAAVGLLVWAYGSFPWISLTLAFSFGFYGLLKKKVRADSLTGLTIETAAIVPACLAYLAWLGWQGRAVVSAGVPLDWGVFGLLVLTGPLTALPLLLFGVGAQRVPLTVVGLSQYIAPTMQFLIALLVFHEPMPPVRFWAVGLVWVAVFIFVADALAAARKARTRAA